MLTPEGPREAQLFEAEIIQLRKEAERMNAKHLMHLDGRQFDDGPRVAPSLVETSVEPEKPLVYRKVTPEQHAEVRRLRASGLSYRGIEKALGLSLSRIHYLLSGRRRHV